MKATFNMYSDQAHGWLKVPKTLLKELNIADKITSYSYQREDYAYLEEDCDLSTFMHAFYKAYKKEVKFIEHYSNTSKIRTYGHYNNGLHNRDR